MRTRTPSAATALLLALLAGCSTPNHASSGGGGGSAPGTGSAGSVDPHAVAAPPDTPTVPGGPSAAAVAGANTFGLELYRRLAAEPGNVAMSPASIAVALAMTLGGARGETAEQMRHTLHAPDDPAALHGGWSTQLAAWRAIGGEGAPAIQVANRLFGERSLAFAAPFLELGRDRYGAPLVPSDFVGAPEAERGRINAWIAEQTRQRIVDLLPPDSIDTSTRLVLANALYFKARWQVPFEKDMTADEPFQLGAGKTKNVPLMHGGGGARYAAIDGVELAELGYAGGRFATLFVLPAENDGLSALEARLDATTLARWVAAMKPTAVAVALPRFRIEPDAPLRLRPHLAALGMPLAFEGGDFSGMAPAELVLDDVYHKAFVAVDEAGTEAAAATAVGAVATSAHVPPELSFRADRPFLYLVRDAETGLVLFAGRVVDP